MAGPVRDLARAGAAMEKSLISEVFDNLMPANSVDVQSAGSCYRSSARWLHKYVVLSRLLALGTCQPNAGKAVPGKLSNLITRETSQFLHPFLCLFFRYLLVVTKLTASQPDWILAAPRLQLLVLPCLVTLP